MIRLAKFLMSSLVILVFVASLTLNILLVSSQAVFSLVAGAVGTATGRSSPVLRVSDDLAAAKNEVDQQRRLVSELREQANKSAADLAIERRINREIRLEITENASLLALERGVSKSLQGELAVRSAQVAGAKIAEERARKLVLEKSQLVTRRLAEAATREATAAVGEAIPGWGVGVIVAATTLELADLCQTVIDMRELAAVYEPKSVPSDEELTVCALKVPSKAELLDAAVSAPGRAWEAAIAAIPDLGQVDWSTMSTGFWEGTLSLGGSVVDGATSAVDAGVDAVSRKNKQLLNWLLE